MRKILMSALLASSGLTFAQTIGNSPYASYGIGDVKYDNSLEHQSMGGVSTAFVSDFNNSFNFKNPAANENLLLTTARIEGTNENNFYRSDVNDYKSTKSSTYLSNIALSFPLSPKVKFGLGYQPYSTKRYEIATAPSEVAGISSVNKFMGQGTVSTVQGAVSYQITPSFGLGLRSNFYFGNIYDVKELKTTNYDIINGLETRTRIRDFNFTAGAVYQKKNEDDTKITVGATATFGNINDGKTVFTNSTYIYDIKSEKIDQQIIATRELPVKNLLPFEVSVGAGYGHAFKWYAGAQLDYKKATDILYEGNLISLNDQFRISAGGYYLPNYNNFRNYFERVVYRYGAYYEKGGLQIAGENINRYAVTFGALFPFKDSGAGNMSGVEIGVEAGHRGTTKNNLISQNFVNFKVGFNFSDRWFRKVLYD